MSSNPMVNEVNKIVYNMLVTEHAVAIPGVGSLRVERRAARRTSKRSVVPPFYVVIFSSQPTGRSLVEAIAQAAECTTDAAQEICDRWLSRTLIQDVLTIDQVGVVKLKHFTPDPAFDKILNPQGRASVVVHSSSASHWLLWSLASIAIVCGLGVCGWILYDRVSEEWFGLQDRLVVADKQLEATVAIPEVVDVDTLAVVSSDGLEIGGGAATEKIAVAEPLQPASTQGASTQAIVDGEAAPLNITVERMVAGRNYLVLGVFSSEDNALRAVKNAMAVDRSLSCGVYRYGVKFMASLFASDDASACAAFAREHAANYPDAWCYKAK